MVIHVRLREERERLGLLQKDVAGLVGMTPRAQLMYEAGDRHPDSNYLAKLAQNGFDVLYILTGQRTPQPSLTAEEASLLDNYHHASEQGKAAARAVLEAVQIQKQKAA